jgi:hypothetical protein
MNKPKAHTSTVRGDAQLTAHIDVNRFMESTVSAQPQKFYRKEADHFFPEGCQCHDDSGSCDWCVIYGNYILNSLDKCAGVKYYTDMMNGGNMTISMYTVPPYSDSFSPFVTLQDAHFKTFDAAESQTAQRARGQYLRGLRILESAFKYLLEQGVAANEQH